MYRKHVSISLDEAVDKCVLGVANAPPNFEDLPSLSMHLMTNLCTSYLE